MASLAVMGREGDTKVEWNPDNEAEVTAARNTFDLLRGKGYAAFRVSGRSNKGEQIRVFDPEAEKIILAPPMQGG